MVLGPCYDVYPQFCGHKGESMKVHELIEILQDHSPNDEVQLAIEPSRPFHSPIRGVVKPSAGSPVFLLEDYGSQPLNIDVWRLLDE